MMILETKRLTLRMFKESDIDAMAAISQDPKVMEHFPDIQTFEQTSQFINNVILHHKSHGYSLYAIELKQTKEMIGFVGLIYRTKEEFDAPFMPATEIGWRLAAKHWNKGYATEAAKAVLDYAFHHLFLDELVSFTAPQNKASQRVMQKIGLHYDASDDFDNPNLPKSSPLCRHVLYRLKREER